MTFRLLPCGDERGFTQGHRGAVGRRTCGDCVDRPTRAAYLRVVPRNKRAEISARRAKPRWCAAPEAGPPPRCDKSQVLMEERLREEGEIKHQINNILIEDDCVPITPRRVFKCVNYIRSAFPVIVLPGSLVTRQTGKMIFFFVFLLKECQKNRSCLESRESDFDLVRLVLPISRTALEGRSDFWITSLCLILPT